MKHLQRITIAALALALWTVAVASPAGAATLEVGGIRQEAPVAIKATLKAGSSMPMTATNGLPFNTCTVSRLEGSSVSPFKATAVSVPLSVLTLEGCVEERFTVDTRGTLTIENIAGTTNGTVRWTGARLTLPSMYGVIACTTENTDVGLLTGVLKGAAVIDFNAVINCGPFWPSTRWVGTYTVTTPEGLGVTS
ncbi:MAG TPA: hypothetical protein VGW80_09925 [Solirubrobacterales bacterium]|jgi:hypothetical protein|nr:hypothetical protein [Solirubrobacterales bacterium]